MKMCYSANRVSGFVVRTSKYFHIPDILKILYSALMRSKLEYASAMESNICINISARSLESVFMLLEVRVALLSCCNVEPLNLRVEKALAKFLFNLMYNSVDFSNNLQKININVLCICSFTFVQNRYVDLVYQILYYVIIVYIRYTGLIWTQASVFFETHIRNFGLVNRYLSVPLLVLNVKK